MKEYYDHDPDRLRAIATHIEQAKTWIISPIAVMLTFPERTEEKEVQRFRKNLREMVAHHARKSKTKIFKTDPRKSLVLTTFCEDSMKDKRRHFHALISISAHLCGIRERLHAFIDPTWQRIKPGKPIHISSYYHKNLHSNEENIIDELSYVAKLSQIPDMEPNKKSFSTSHWRFMFECDLGELLERPKARAEPPSPKGE